jgi:uncharacterized RDD family membrane protein YckC
MNYGGFWIRFLAYLVDSLIVGVGFFAIVMLLALMGLELFSQELVYFVMVLLYWALMQSSARQATLGKSLLGLKVTGQGGERISFARALAREAAKILSTLTLLIGFIIAGFTKNKQALHDFIASTYVVRESPGHVLAAVGVALVALFAPVIAVTFYGAGLVTGLMGGMAGALMSSPEIVVQVPKSPAPQPPVPQPQPQVQAVQAPSPQAKPAPAPAAVPTTTAPAPAPAKPSPAAKPVRTSMAAPAVVAQAPEPAKPAAAPTEPAKPKPVAKKPAKPAPTEAAAAPAEEKPKPAPAPPKAPPPVVAAAPMAAPPPAGALRFNDLVTAVLYRDAGAVNELLAFGKWPDRADSRGMTPLMLAVELGDAPIAEALLKAGADPSRAMSIARERKNAAMVGLLQRHGAR